MAAGRDADGTRLVTIESVPKTHNARLIVGDPKGVAVNRSAGGDVAAVQLIDATDKAKVLLESTPAHAGMGTFEKLGKTWVGWDGADQTPRVAVQSKVGWPVVEMRSLPESQTGQLSVANAAGDKLMSVGENATSGGMLKMGPNGNRAAVLLGNQGLPASSLQGKKSSTTQAPSVATKHNPQGTVT